MKIKKLGHCCLVIETNGKRIMTDPGSYTVDEQSNEKNIDLILITHEHGDHLHVESLKNILKNNTEAAIITNSGDIRTSNIKLIIASVNRLHISPNGECILSREIINMVLCPKKYCGLLPYN